MNDCTVRIDAGCDTAAAGSDLQFFCGASATPFQLSSRLIFEHKSTPTPINVRGISNRLSGVVWLEPPHVTSVFSENPANWNSAAFTPRTSKTDPMVVYLPVVMGKPDLILHVRAYPGIFSNPDEPLDGDIPKPQFMRFGQVLEQETDNVDLARLRQTLHLCWMGKELLQFLDSRNSSNAPPFIRNYNGYWKSKFTSSKQRCDQAEVRMKKIQFVPGQFPKDKGQITH